MSKVYLYRRIIIILFDRPIFPWPPVRGNKKTLKNSVMQPFSCQKTTGNYFIYIYIKNERDKSHFRLF